MSPLGCALRGDWLLSGEKGGVARLWSTSRGVEVCPASRGIDFAEQIKSGYTHGETRIKERIGGKFGDKNIVMVGRTPSLQQVTLRPAGRIVTFTPEHRPDSFERCRTDAGVVVLAR